VSNIPLLDLEAGPIAAGGGCVARANDGRVVFVRHCLPGERVFAAVTEETKSYLRADALEIIHSSRIVCRLRVPTQAPDDVEAVTGSTSRLAAQRRLKADLVAEQLRRLAGIERVVEVEEVAGAPDGSGGGLVFVSGSTILVVSGSTGIARTSYSW